MGWKLSPGQPRAEGAFCSVVNRPTYCSFIVLQEKRQLCNRPFLCCSPCFQPPAPSPQPPYSTLHQWPPPFLLGLSFVRLLTSGFESRPGWFSLRNGEILFLNGPTDSPVSCCDENHAVCFQTKAVFSNIHTLISSSLLGNLTILPNYWSADVGKLNGSLPLWLFCGDLHSVISRSFSTSENLWILGNPHCKVGFGQTALSFVCKERMWYSCYESWRFTEIFWRWGYVLTQQFLWWVLAHFL